MEGTINGIIVNYTKPISFIKIILCVDNHYCHLLKQGIQVHKLDNLTNLPISKPKIL